MAPSVLDWTSLDSMTQFFKTERNTKALTTEMQTKQADSFFVQIRDGRKEMVHEFDCFILSLAQKGANYPL